MARKRHSKKTHVISIIIWIFAMISLILLTFQIYKANVLPSKYYKIIAFIYIFMLVVFFLFVLNKKTKKPILIFFNIIFIILISIVLFGSYKINDVMNFLDNNFGITYDTNIYYILVNKESNYKEINDIENKTIKLYNDQEHIEEIKRNIKKKLRFDLNYEYVDAMSTQLYDLKTNKDLILFANAGDYDAIIENDDIIKSDIKFKDTVNILETIEVKSKVVSDTTGIDVTNDPFVIFLSGIDTRSNKLPARSGSDVNIIIAINPNTNKILMINTPRDYYVQLHGTTGLKDKLTHAGLVGGYKLSMDTISDLYDVDIKYFVRVNFNAVVKLVDALGGITVNSDVNYPFTCLHGHNCRIKPGLNNLNGDCALGFVRERYAYKTGDRHRGENQEQVIQKIIEKVTSSETILNKSGEILNSLSGTFQTNVTSEEIKSLVKMQLEDMNRWDISTYNVTGSDLYAKTNSYPNTDLYVMVPKLETVETAKQKLKDVLATE